MLQVPSPFKKRQREEEKDSSSKRRRSSIDKQAATSAFFKTEKSTTVPDSGEEKLKEIAAKTREKLQGFLATDIESFHEGSSNNIAEFDFTVLKREKAAAIPDLDIHNDDIVTNNKNEDDHEDKDVEIMETESSSAASASVDLLSVFKNKQRSSAVLTSAQKGNQFAFSIYM